MIHTLKSYSAIFSANYDIEPSKSSSLGKRIPWSVSGVPNSGCPNTVIGRYLLNVLSSSILVRLLLKSFPLLNRRPIGQSSYCCFCDCCKSNNIVTFACHSRSDCFFPQSSHLQYAWDRSVHLRADVGTRVLTTFHLTCYYATEILVMVYLHSAWQSAVLQVILWSNGTNIFYGTIRWISKLSVGDLFWVLYHGIAFYFLQIE